MEWLLSISTLLQHLLRFIFRLFYAFVHRKKPASLPPIKDPLLKLSATALARMIRMGEISSQTVVETYIRRIKEVNPFINAVIEDRFEAAMNEAKTCDEKLKAGEITIVTLERDLPLYGVPFTVKESCSLKGMSYTGCTVGRQGIKASEDSVVVERLKSAGGIALCVTNTPELCSGFHTSNRLFGTTNNPYDTRKTAGGSSGGEGALIGAGASLIGVGSDLAGSIRIPAHLSGIFGHKPTPGIIPIKGHLPLMENETFQNYLVLGPLARYADDLHLAVKIMSSECGYDLRLDDPVDVKKLRVFHMDSIKSSLGVRSTTSEIRKKIQDATQYFAGNGAVVQQLPQNWLDNFYNVQMAVFFGKKENLPQILVDPRDPKRKIKAMVEYAKAFLGLSQFTKSAIFMQLLIEVNALVPSSRLPQYTKALEELRENVVDLLKNDGILLYPTYPRATFLQELAAFSSDYSVYCIFANILKLPATHVPLGLNKDGLPIGLQVIAGPRQDRLCLAVARELEKQFGGWIPPAS